MNTGHEGSLTTIHGNSPRDALDRLATLAKTVADIGGGQGALVAAILNSKPHLKGILFDRPSAVVGAPGVLQAQGVADRCDVIGGDFFQAVPAADVYTLKWVLSDWDDARARQILQNCRRAMNPGGKVLVVDPVAMAGQERFSLSMVVVWNGGGVRTEAELRALLASAGLAVERVLPTETLFHIVEAKAA
jgi:SAM-dependent methyltransferase